MSEIITIPILSNYKGNYKLVYDGKYITLFGDDSDYPAFNGGFENMILISVVKEIKNAQPKIKNINSDFIEISLFDDAS